MLLVLKFILWFSGSYTLTFNSISFAPSTWTTIVAVPSPTKVIFPFSSTVATDSSEDVKVASLVLSCPLRVTIICCVSLLSPRLIENSFLATSRLGRLFTLTSNVTSASVLSTCTLILVFPALSAVIVPLSIFAMIAFVFVSACSDIRLKMASLVLSFPST